MKKMTDSSFTVTMPEEAAKLLEELGETPQNLFDDALCGRLDARIGEIKGLRDTPSRLEKRDQLGKLRATLSSS
jgi:hypothetical protein